MLLRLFAPASVLVACLLCNTQANAQTADSAYFNLGRVKLLKSATQHVSVKAEDLQRFPAANLTDAVNFWFSGYFSDTNSLVYVVDGNLATDVNQYPIYDIEEITLIQNAVTQLNGISQQQQLVLVTTKRNRSGNSGITAAAQGSLVKLQTNRFSNNTSSKGANAYYQQYQLSAYKNVNQVHFGISANYLRDAFPGTTIPSRTDLINPQLKRWRFNGYFNAQLWAGTVLDVTGGYVPQNYNQQIALQGTPNVVSEAKIDTKENIYNGSFNLHSQLLPGLTNELRGVYNNYTSDYNSSSFVIFNTGTVSNNYNSTTFNNNKLRNVVIYDELRFSRTLGNFTLSPAINFNYRNIKSSNLNRATTGSSYSLNTSTLTAKTYILTPTLTVDYHNAVNLAAGFVQVLNSVTTIIGTQPKKFFPFVTASANVSRLLDTGAKVNVNVYGSYAVTNRLNDTYTILSYLYPYNVTANYNPLVSNIGIAGYVNDKSFKTFTLGSTIGLFQNKLELSYNYENRKNFTPIVYSVNGYYTIVNEASTKYISHRIAAAFNLVKTDNLSWRTQLNVTNYKQNIAFASGTYNTYINGLYNKTWTGGWTNRLQYKNFVGGVDLTYLLGKNNNLSSSTLNFNSFALQNLFAGWRIKTSKLNNLEVYASGRNLFQNKQSILPDYRRYIGIGLQASL